MSLPFLLYKLSQKKSETFFLDQSQSRAKIQTMARKAHTLKFEFHNLQKTRLGGLSCIVALFLKLKGL